MPLEIDALVARMLSKEPADRPQSMADVDAALAPLETEARAATMTLALPTPVLTPMPPGLLTPPGSGARGRPPTPTPARVARRPEDTTFRAANGEASGATLNVQSRGPWLFAAGVLAAGPSGPRSGR